jgi:hypothetical protein
MVCSVSNKTASITTVKTMSNNVYGNSIRVGSDVYQALLCLKHGDMTFSGVIADLIEFFLTKQDAILDAVRPEVLTFALLMERKLRKHDTERGDSYKTSNVDYLLMRLREEVKELHNVIEDDPWDGKGVSLGETVDVGNIAMMVGYHDYQFPMDVFISELKAELRSSKQEEQR